MAADHKATPTSLQCSDTDIRSSQFTVLSRLGENHTALPLHATGDTPASAHQRQSQTSWVRLFRTARNNHSFAVLLSGVLFHYRGVRITSSFFVRYRLWTKPRREGTERRATAIGKERRSKKNNLINIKWIQIQFSIRSGSQPNNSVFSLFSVCRVIRC